MRDIDLILTEHKALSFPASPEDDEFAEWISELAETDAYYVGLAASGLAEFRKKANISFLVKLEDQVGGFSKLTGNDKLIYEQSKAYLSSLRSLVNAYSQ